MKVPKIERRVRILCLGGSLIYGMIHISEGLRVSDSLNDTRETFLAVTQAQIADKNCSVDQQNCEEAGVKKEIVMVNKTAIEWIEEV